MLPLNMQPAQLVMPITRAPQCGVPQLLPLQGQEHARWALENPFTVLCLVGSAASGKSHLAKAWATSAGALFYGATCPVLAPGAVVVVDDVQALDAVSQTNVFHALNNLAQHGGQLLLTSAGPLAEVGLLPDVRSRLLTYPQVFLAAPSAADLKLLMLKWAADAQVQLEPAVVAYLLSRATRSAAALQQLLARLDALSLAEKRTITVPLVRQVLSAAEGV